MAPFEITEIERSFVASSSFPELLSGLTEKDRRATSAAVASRRRPIVRTVEIKSRGMQGVIVPFHYFDYGGPEPAWLMPVLQGFANLVALPVNWDGEGASKIDTATVNRGLAAAARLLDSGAPPPSIVPLSNSGLQIEWHRNQKDLEIEFSPRGGVSFYYFDELTEEEYEGPVGPDFVYVKRYLARIW